MNAPLPCRLLVVLLVVAWPALAQQAPSPAPRADGADAASIGGDAGRGLDGRGAINLAAGSGNAQANLAAIALAGGPRLDVAQGVQAAPAALAALRRRDATARIDGHAFAGSTGLLSINQVAGSGNTQLNVFALGQGGAAVLASSAGLDDAALASVAGSPSAAAGEEPRGLRRVEIAEGAFDRSQGVVQLNQTAGVGNVSTNAIVLQLPGGAP